MKWIGSLFAGLAGIVSHIPEYVMLLFFTAIFMTLVDMVTGSIYAWCDGKVMSRKVLRGFFIKVSQFGTLYAIFSVPVAVGYVVTKTPLWQIMTVPSLIILWLETVSNVENMYKMERFGGVQFPDWVKDLIGRLAKGLQVAAEGQMSQHETRAKLTVIGGISSETTNKTE